MRKWTEQVLSQLQGGAGEPEAREVPKLCQEHVLGTQVWLEKLNDKKRRLFPIFKKKKFKNINFSTDGILELQDIPSISVPT